MEDLQVDTPLPEAFLSTFDFTLLIQRNLI